MHALADQFIIQQALFSRTECSIATTAAKEDTALPPFANEKTKLSRELMVHN